MKRTMLFTAALAALAMFASCQKEQLIETPTGVTEFTATIEQPTRTAIASDGKVTWVAGDEITITDGASNSSIYVAESSGAFTTFTLKEGQTPVGAGPYTATYGDIAKQIYDAAGANCPLTAPSTSGTTLHFSSPYALLKITAKSPNAEVIKSVEVTYGANKSTLICKGGVALTASGKDFYVAVEPAESAALSVTFFTAVMNATKTRESAVTLAARNLLPLTLTFAQDEWVATKTPVSDMKYSKAVYSEDGGPHWEFTMRNDNSDSGYPVLVLKAGPAYSEEFIEGNFNIISAVLQTGESESIEYKDNFGTVTITCTESGTEGSAGKYSYDINTEDASGNEVELIPSGLSTSAKDAAGEDITLKDKSASDPNRKSVEDIGFPAGYNPQIVDGAVTKLSLNVTPADATNPYAYWTSSNPSVATVDAYGNVTGVGEGTATITATSIDGNMTATCSVTVSKSPIFQVQYAKAVYSEEGGPHWEFTLSKKADGSNYPLLIVKAGPAYSGEFIEGDFNIISATLQTKKNSTTKYKDNAGTVTITCTESGAEGSNGEYSFVVNVKDPSSGNDIVLTGRGLPTSAEDAAGKAITLKDKDASDPDFKPVTGISFPKDYKPQIEPGTSIKLAFDVTPSDATNPYAQWTSSDESVATVDAYGNVTGVGEGTAIITAISVDGKRITTCTVAVEESPVSEMKYSKAVYSEEGGPHWEFTMRNDNSDSGYPVFILKAGPAYSGEFIEGDFNIISAVLKTSASESISYKDNAGTVSITCTESGTEGTAGKYSYAIKAKSASGNDVILNASGVSTSAKDAAGEDITLKDKDASDPTRKPVTDISFPKDYKPEVIPGTSTTLSFDVTPSDATNPYAQWTSSDESVATVDATGKVTGVGAGTATITATSVDGKKTATCTVKVKGPAEVMDSAEATYKEDENGAYWEFDMSKSDSEDGYPKLIVKAGPAYSGEFIEGDFNIISAVLKTSASKSTSYKDNAGTMTVTCTESGAEGTDGKYSFDVKAKDASNKDVELITNPLTTSAKDAGGEDITLKDKSASDPNRKDVTGISFPKDYKPEVAPGISTTLAFDVTPSDATNPYAFWTSSDPSVATVDATGKVTGVGAGTATITATSVDGKKTATCTVTVKSPVEVLNSADAIYKEDVNGAYWEFDMSKSDSEDGYPKLIVKAGPAYSGEFIEGDFNIISAVLKTSASKSTSYKDNAGTVTVTCTKSGTASSAGKYSFDVKAKDASNKDVELITNPLTTSAKDAAEKAITLKDKDASDPTRKAVTGISFPSGYKPEAFVGSSTKLSFNVNPADATNPYAYWTSSNPSVATVDAYGNVKGLEEGTATITATSVDGKKTATCNVTVKAPVKAVYSEEGGAHWEFTIHIPGGNDGYPALIVKAGPAYSGEFIEGDFNILSAVLKTSASASTSYKANAGTVTITCTKSGTASSAGKYSFDIKAKDASNEDVVFTETGLLTRAETTGGVAITLKDKDASDPTRKAVTGISFPEDYKPDLAPGNSMQLSYTVNPSDATNPYVYWESSDPSVATVDAYGMVKAIKEGTATITITSVDGKKTATCIFTVRTGTSQYDDIHTPNWF